MKFHTEHTLMNLSAELLEVLSKLRARRAFNVENYVRVKAEYLNQYMLAAGLKACVIAVSGGIDSAVTLALVHHASKLPNSPIQKIVPVTLPIFKPVFTTNQDGATDRATEVIKKFGLEPHVIELTKPFLAMKESVDNAIGVKGEGWASGQLVSYMRTPAYYYVTSLMSQSELPSIVCGTTNRDEGCYLGYFGKASDGMVDVQLISDLHKSEVRKVAAYLGVPDSILKVVPTGDMFDGRIDEEVFGASYDFVELFLLLKALEKEADRKAYLDGLSEQSAEQYSVLSGRLEDLHRFNGHKYIGKSPAVHLDILESGIRGGWPTGNQRIDYEPRGKEFFVNAFDLSSEIWPSFFGAEPVLEMKKLPVIKGDAWEIVDLMNEEERMVILNQANAHGWKPVGIDGYMSHYKEGDKVGSYRASTFSPDLAEVLWKRLSPKLTQLRLMKADDPTDWLGHQAWRAIGVSPLFRFIRYTDGGLLVPHYDAPFTYQDGNKTLMSLVIYLNAKDITGGMTRFIKDPQIDLPLDKKDYADWNRYAKDDEILFTVDPQPGHAIVFDHRILHDSLAISGNGEKVIIRTDIIYTPCGLK
ncbi:NAD(+) synthase [Candidatus Peregrinibacteria bacterium]|nr:NAD(+) synthase [Candidatus Peregrinibacteria bacterium]